MSQVGAVQMVKNGCIRDIFLEVESIGFPKKSDLNCERNKNDPKVFHRGKWKGGLFVNWDGENFDTSGNQTWHVEFKTSNTYSSRDVE